MRLGTAGTAVSVADQGNSLQPLGGTLSIVGGAGSNSLSVYDQSDAGATNPIGPALVTLGPGNISRVDFYQVYITTLGWVPATATRTIDYSSFSLVTFNADNLGTPVDIEGISTATTVNLGSGNTAVTVAESARSLSSSSFLNKTVPLTLVGGPGSDSLTVDDQQESSYSGGSSVTVSAGSIVRTDRIANVPYPLEAIIDYQDFSAGVTLNSDDVGTAVNIEFNLGAHLDRPRHRQHPGHGRGHRRQPDPARRRPDDRRQHGPRQPDRQRFARPERLDLDPGRDSALHDELFLYRHRLGHRPDEDLVRAGVHRSNHRRRLFRDGRRRDPRHRRPRHPG